MTVVTVKIEQMYPERKLIEECNWNDLGRSLRQMTEAVEQHIKCQMNIYRHKFPEMTELRWEFADIGQGHYIQISDLPLNVFVGRLTYDQLQDVLKKAIEIRDWQMAEDVCYQLKLMGDIMIESFGHFELPYAIYEFDWMFNDDIELEVPEDDGSLEEQVVINMVPILHPDDEYYRLAKAVKNKEVGFESNGQWIINPFYDETLRDQVDPQGYYGWVKIKQWMIETDDDGVPVDCDDVE